MVTSPVHLLVQIQPIVLFNIYMQLYSSKNSVQKRKHTTNWVLFELWIFTNPRLYFCAIVLFLVASGPSDREALVVLLTSCQLWWFYIPFVNEINTDDGFNPFHLVNKTRIEIVTNDETYRTRCSFWLCKFNSTENISHKLRHLLEAPPSGKCLVSLITWHNHVFNETDHSPQQRQRRSNTAKFNDDNLLIFIPQTSD